jgi:hypothetical protein
MEIGKYLCCRESQPLRFLSAERMIKGKRALSKLPCALIRRGALAQMLLIKSDQSTFLTWTCIFPGRTRQQIASFLKICIASPDSPAAGKNEVFECDMTGKTYDCLTWEQKTWELAAVDTITILEFHRAMPCSVNCGPSFGEPPHVPARSTGSA